MVNTNKTGSEHQTRGFLRGRVELLKAYWTQYQALHDQILDTKNPSSDQDVFSEIETLYSEHLGTLNYMIDGADIQSIQHVPPVRIDRDLQSKSEVKLPRITIPSFSGDYGAWTSFHDLFDSLVIKNKSLSNVQRLHHLKSFLSGEAEQLLRQYSIQDNNFDPAWALLKKRYANKRLLINNHFERFLNQPRVTGSSAEGLRHLLDTSLECISSVRNLLQEDQLFETLVLHIVSQKLDIKSLEAWEKSIQGNEDPASLNDFTAFLDDSCRTMELVNSTKKHADVRPTAKFEKKSFDFRPVKSFHSSTDSPTVQSTSTSTNCRYCDKPHSINQCFRFRTLKLPERLKYVSSNLLCNRCLGSGHQSQACLSSNTCSKCSQNHHTLLHPTFGSDPIQVHSVTSQRRDQTDLHSPRNVHFSRPKTALLATALISVHSNGTPVTLRALLDQGSETSLISNSAVKLLNIKIQKSTVSIKGIGQSQAGEVKGFVNLRVHSLFNSSSFEINALVLPKLTGLLPSFSFVPQPWNHIKDLEFADPGYYKSSEIDLILGADIYGDLLLEGNNIRKGPKGSPTAQLTELGWILSGNISPKVDHHSTATSPNSIEILSCFSQTTVCEQLRKFWEIEDVSNTKGLSIDDDYCESLYQDTHKRLPNGQYEVNLPFKSPFGTFPEFGSTRPQCISRLKQVQKRISKNPELCVEYSAFMDEYSSLNHMYPIAHPGLPRDVHSFYLPHHAVIKSSSSTTKVRVVFDASCKSSNGSSLNDQLYTGPTIQQDLIDILLRWRKHKVVIVSDIEKMYRQISVTPEHRQFQRIVWQDKNNKLQDFELSTVTYGTSCAPYLAIRTIKQLATDEQTSYPMASKHALSDMYVDDFISGADTIEECKVLCKEMMDMFSCGGFNLRKWSTNSEEILRIIPMENRETISLVDICKDLTLKTLGVYWNPQQDVFHFQINLSPSPNKCTKRTLLSDVARLFDPLGCLSPVIISAKILFQQLWLQGLDWDDALPEDVCTEWLKLRTSLPVLEQIEIPRWIHTSKDTSTIQLHGFCDASTKAYGAAVYIRTEKNGLVSIHLLTSKTRVAPIKRISLPHLELCGATLLSKLLARVSDVMNIGHVPAYAWTDSTIVLAWLTSHTHKNTFVANRVSIILNNLQPTQWSHVRSSDNAADIASRGICPTKLNNHMLWWFGPKWLKESPQSWLGNGQDAPGVHQPAFIFPNTDITTVNTILIDTIMNIIERFSSYHRLIRTVAYCLRFINMCRPSSRKPAKYTTFLEATDCENALNRIILGIQSLSYSSEMASIRDGKPISSSSILALNPFISSDGLLRVGGRLINSTIQYDQKFPILIPRDNHFCRLLIEKVHLETLHGGIRLTLATLRLSFWVPSARAMIRKVIFNCKTCHRYSIKTKHQLMGALPSVRVTPSRAFSHSGVDYAGPMSIRMSRHRGKSTYKGYVVVFVCMSSKAIHLELVSDLSTDAFLAAFKRFTSRRGPCSNIYSDNGTNFVGASRKLHDEYEKTIVRIEKDAAESLACNHTSWHFIPPGSPHFGGIWEASVRSMKYHLKRIIGQTILTYEELNTLLVQIEGTLNSRPLCELPSEIEPQALTPAHLLIGAPIVSLPQTSLLHLNENRLDRWKLLIKLHQDFWKSWSSDYLSDLQQRPRKWRKQHANLEIGDVVIMKDELQPPTLWRLARVIDTHPGEDGIVRVVTVHHKTGQCKRPVSKLCYLPNKDWNELLHQK